MAQDTNIENLIINKLTRAQYESIANPDPTQLYFITDEVISSADVISALGYTPYNASNPEGYTSNVGTVTSVNNIQPDINGNVSLTIPDTATWGNITGTLSNQTDLQNVLDGKLSATSLKTINSQSLIGNGNLSLVELDINEGWNNTQNTGLENNQWTAYAYGNGKYAAISGGNGYTATSTNGTSWTTILDEDPQLSLYWWQGMAYGDNKFIAIDDSGLLSTSTDGATWTTPYRPSGWSGRLSNIFYDGGKFIAFTCDDYTNYDLYTCTSTDGVTWSSISDLRFDNSVRWTAGEYGNGKYVIISNAGYVSISTDGSTWNTPTQAISRVNNNLWLTLVYDGNKFIVAGTQGYLSTSTDGINWTTPVQYNELVNIIPRKLVYDGSKLVLLGSNGQVATFISSSSIPNIVGSSLNIGFGDTGNNYELLNNSTGLIPDARISNNIARTNQIPSLTGYATENWVTNQNYVNGTTLTNTLANYTLTSILAEVATSGDYNDLINQPTIPSEVTESTVSAWGFTKNIGTVTSVNNISPINGNVTIPVDNALNKNSSNPVENRVIAQALEEISLAKNPNLNLIGGNLNIDSGNVSGFSTTDYMQFPFVFNFNGYHWTLEMGFTTGSDVTTQQNILDSYYGIAFAIRNGKFVLAISSNGSSWDIANTEGTYSVQANTAYSVKIAWDDTNYTLSYALDETNYTTDITVVSALIHHSTQEYVGGEPDLYGSGQHPFSGTINLNNWKLIVNILEVWLGMDDVGLGSRANIDLSNLTEAGQYMVDTVKDQNDGDRLKYWTGIKAEYDAIVTKDATTLYFLTDVGKIYFGDTLISNVGSNTLLDFKWSDHQLNDIQWLRADTFSWQSGDVYTSAYNHLVQDIQGTTAETETIGSYTVTFYRATDGHKICLVDQEQTVLNIYNESGVAWYYILDTTNTQFKLPRENPEREVLGKSAPVVGNGMTLGFYDNVNYQGLLDMSGVSGIATSSSAYGKPLGTANLSGDLTNHRTLGVTTDPTKSGLIAQLSDITGVYKGKQYLYFYVGDYSQTAIEQTAGLNSELFNGKADTDLSNVPTSKGILTESYVNGTSWYRVYSDGWCEQGGDFGGVFSSWTTKTVTFLKPFKNTNYTVISTMGYTTQSSYPPVTAKTTTTFKCYTYNSTGTACWYACGYIN